MGETVKTEKAPKTSFFDGLKGRVQKDHMAGPEDGDEADHCGGFRFCGSGRDHRRLGHYYR